MMENKTIQGYSMRCSGHNYVSLFYDGKLVHCYDNNLRSDNPRYNEYYAEDIISKIEKRTRMKITDIPIIGCVDDFDGLRFMNGGFKKGHEWLLKSQEHRQQKEG